MRHGYYEDNLTADVFTAFRYLPADRGIIGFLRSIPGLEAKIPSPDENSTCEIHFWPLGVLGGREPDVLLELIIQDQAFHVVVEAKYRAGLGDRTDSVREVDGELEVFGKQLVDEFRDLQHGIYTVQRRLKGQRRALLSSASQDRFLLYLTAHLTEPTNDIEAATRRVPQAVGRIFWANWFRVHDYLSVSRIDLGAFPYRRVIDDVCRLLDRKGFSPFEGVAGPPGIEVCAISGSFWHLFGQQPTVDLSRVRAGFWNE